MSQNQATSSNDFAHHVSASAHGSTVLGAQPPPRTDAVQLGAAVAIVDLSTNEREEYTLVPPGDANILYNRISSFSPMGRSIYGRQVGDVVEVTAPSGTIKVRIEDIRFDP